MDYTMVERGYLCPRGHARYPRTNHAPDCTPDCHPPDASLEAVGGWVWLGNLSGWEVGPSGLHHRCGYLVPWQDEGLWAGPYLGNVVEEITTKHQHDCRAQR